MSKRGSLSHYSDVTGLCQEGKVTAGPGVMASSFTPALAIFSTHFRKAMAIAVPVSMAVFGKIEPVFWRKLQKT